MGFLDDLLGNVDRAIGALETAAQKVEAASEGVNNRIEQIADAPHKLPQALQSSTAALDAAILPSETSSS